MVVSRKSTTPKKSSTTGRAKNNNSTSKKSSNSNKKDEIQQSKSPAEFFAENQSIAGFDNPGKSLYTTLRELIENSLDACESVNVLPDICVAIEEMTQSQFNEMRGVPGNSPVKKSKGKKKTNNNDDDVDDDDDDDDDNQDDTNDNANDEKKATPKGKETKKTRAGGDAYFLVTVRDNGCGMAHDAIPELLGRVLSGSKYGVRQTRGKFGLGAKMALIWSKKSTGMPIRVETSHVKGARGGGGGSLLDEEGERKIGSKISSCVLDIGEITYFMVFLLCGVLTCVHDCIYSSFGNFAFVCLILI